MLLEDLKSTGGGGGQCREGEEELRGVGVGHGRQREADHAPSERSTVRFSMLFDGFLWVSLGFRWDFGRYVYDCFKFEVGEQASLSGHSKACSQADQYPKVCAALSKEQAFTLAQILVTKLKQKSFDKYWDMVDVDNKASKSWFHWIEGSV